MVFTAPALLAALALLPAIWWLLRARPPAPRRIVFPPVRLLLRLRQERNDAATPPVWLLALRIAAATLLILGFADPVRPGNPMPLTGSGALLLAIDDGVMSASSWPERVSAARMVLSAAAHGGRPVILLRTADRDILAAAHSASGASKVGAQPASLSPASAARAAELLEAARPAPWPIDRAAATLALRNLRDASTSVGGVVYISDGVATPVVVPPARADSKGAEESAAHADQAFAEALRNLAPVQEIRIKDGSPVVLVPRRGGVSSENQPAPESAPASKTGEANPSGEANVVATVVIVPDNAPRLLRIRAHAQDGGTIGLSEVTAPAFAREVPVPLALPAAMRNRIDMLTVDGVPSAAAALLLDEGDRVRPVGIISVGVSDTPLVGPLFYLRRALAPNADIREGSVSSLLSQPLSVMIAPDGALADSATRKRVADWVRGGGVLIRFAGRTLTGGGDDTPAADSAEEPPNAPAETISESLLPVPLMANARQLGGAMSWGKPQPLAPFASTSPFHGLPVSTDVSVSRQVLARPASDLGDHSWARLADGTPLVTHAALGKGDVILFHVTATADWSNLPLSGLFVSMLERLIEHANGVDAPADDAMLSPVLTLDGDGALGPPPPFARGLAANRFGAEAVSPEHPPGLYGARADRRALNVGDTIRRLDPLTPTGALTDPTGHRPDHAYGPTLIALALALLCVDAVWTLALRGGALLRVRALTRGRRSSGSQVLRCSILIVGGLGALSVTGGSAAFAQSPAPPSSAPLSSDSPVTNPTSPRPISSVPATAPGVANVPVPQAALETRLAYVLTGDSEVDTVSQEGLQGLSTYVNARTSAVLGHPDGVRPGTDDLSYYPLLYWPVTANAQTTPAMTAALTSFMAHGGIIVIDTQGVDPASAPRQSASGDDEASFAGEAPGAAAALRRVTAGLPIPPLTKLDDHHVLAHTFYLLHDFPGRYAGQPVWVAREGEAENDDVSPVIIGAADWAHVWALDADGNAPFAAIPGGDEQRRTAYRFGVNAVIYALTGNYKADQVHVPAILKRLGQ